MLPMGVAPKHVTRLIEDVMRSGSLFGACSRQEKPCIIAVVVVVCKADDYVIETCKYKLYVYDSWSRVPVGSY